jgi:Ca2+-binding EF-hand superfamily protein
MLNELLASKGQPNATFNQFKKFFNEMDVNGDGVISKQEIIRFVRLFLGMPYSL